MPVVSRDQGLSGENVELESHAEYAEKPIADKRGTVRCAGMETAGLSRALAEILCPRALYSYFSADNYKLMFLWRNFQS
ncbi:hypothetical protein [Nitratireductor indicus]|uniref:hypothetical protein n=1 Tax=Nitratireductor indicus TaxID=721133 RepID=UPI0011608BF8|nr:hypothetical protein [Nitratireductor indicus]